MSEPIIYDNPATFPKAEPEIIPAADELEHQQVLNYGRELAIAALEGTTALKVLQEALADNQAEWEASIGKGVLNSGRPIDQRNLDYTRGHFSGARFWLHGRVALAKSRVADYERQQELDPAEDPRPVGRDDPRWKELISSE